MNSSAARDQIKSWIAQRSTAIVDGYVHQKLSMGALARAFGCPETRIREALLQAGVKPRSAHAGAGASPC